MSDPVPQAVPDGWALTTLGEVFEINPPKPDVSHLGDDEEVTFVSMGSVDEVTGMITDPQVRQVRQVTPALTGFREGDVLMAKITPCMENGKSAIAQGLARGIGFGSTQFHVLRATEPVMAKYLLHFIRQPAFLKEAEANMTGTGGLKGLPVGFLRAHSFPLPPLAEQERIVAKVESAIQQAKATHGKVEEGLASVRNMRETAMTDACSGKLTADWRAANPEIEPASTLLEQMAVERKSRWAEWHSAKKYVEPQRHEETDLGSLPPNWVWATFDQCAADITVGHVGSLRGKYVDEGVPFLRSQNVRPLYYSPKGLECISPDSHRSMGKSKLLGGELLVTRSGANVGDCCVYPRNAGEANCADLVITRPLSGLLPEYAAIYVCSQDGQSRLLEKGTGIAQPHFNIGAMRKKPFPLPPLEEQREIIRCVESALRAADAMEAQLRSTGEQADGMVQVTMEQAFSGKLVPTEASLARAEGRSFEDAHALLARIQQELAARPATPRRTKSSRKTILKGHAMKNLIDEVLRASATPLTAEKVFKESGHTENEVEQFFVELRRLEREGRVVVTTGPKGETLLSVPNNPTAA